MRYLVHALGAFALLGPAACSAADTALFNGHDFAGWEFISPSPTGIDRVCQILPDGVIAASGKPTGFIATTPSHENYRLHAEWRWPDKPGNSGVLLHISSGPRDRAWPLSLQVQMKNKSAGDLLPMAGATFAEPLAADQKTPVRFHTNPDSEKPAGEWNSCDIVCRGDTIEVTVNGVLQNSVSQAFPAGGRIGFQFEGTPFEIRHVTLSPLE